MFEIDWYWWPLIAYIVLAIITPSSGEHEDNPANFT